jgi:peptidyl-prolyl cis-trans isomerase C
MKWLPLCALLLLGCKPAGTEVNFRHSRTAGTKVATFADDAITAEELKQRFSEMSPYARARYQTVEARREYVDGVARFEMLAREAVKQGLANDPEVIETAKRVMVDRLLKKELDEKPTPVPDAELAAYYEQHKADYNKPEMIRLSHLFVPGAKSDPAAHEKAKARAEEALGKARALQQMDYQGFAQLVREYSEEPRTKPLDGDMRFLSRDELAKEYGPEVDAAAANLTNVGQLSEGVVETEHGYHVLKLQGRQTALALTLDQVKPQLQNILLHEKRMKNYAALLDKLTKEQGYKVMDDQLAKVEIDVKAPTAEQKGPTPNLAPAPLSQGGPTQ